MRNTKTFHDRIVAEIDDDRLRWVVALVALANAKTLNL